MTAKRRISDESQVIEGKATVCGKRSVFTFLPFPYMQILAWSTDAIRPYCNPRCMACDPPQPAGGSGIYYVLTLFRPVFFFSNV